MDNGTHTDVRLRVPERHQLSMVVRCPDDLVDADHPVRVVWAAVERLDLSAFRAPIRARAGVCGRDATDPRLLVALWLQACTDGVGSARELARLCVDSRPYQWPCGGVGVNHHLLGDFRVGFGDALDALFTQVIATLVERDLVTVHRVSQDGTRVRACAGSNSFRRQGRLARLLEEARRHVAELRALLAPCSTTPSAAPACPRRSAPRWPAPPASGSNASRTRSPGCRNCDAGRPSSRGRFRRRTRPRASSGSPGPAPRMPTRG